MKALVTGGTGFIGSSVVRSLLDSGYRVRVLLRKSSNPKNIKGLSVEKAFGDLLCPKSLRKAVQGCQLVFHVAALYSFWVQPARLIYQINVEGTREVLRACLETGVERVVYTSSVSTLKTADDSKPVTEDSPAKPDELIGDYKKSKYLAEQVAMEFAQDGLPVVIVNPSFPVGKGDIKPTPTGQVILSFLNRRMPGYLDTGMNVVDVEDVAEGHILAACRGKIGERYILGGENMSMRELLETLSDITGLPAPGVRLPYWPILGLSYLNYAFSRFITHNEPQMTPDSVRMAKHPMYYDPSKAIEELGLPQTPPRKTLRKTVKWFVKNDYVKEKYLPNIRKELMDS